MVERVWAQGPIPFSAASFLPHYGSSRVWEVAGDMAGELKRSEFDGKKTLAFMGDEIEGQLKESIIELVAPPLSKTTLRLRLKFRNQPQNIRARNVVQAQIDVANGKPVASGTEAKPLVWTGQMLNSTSYKVS